MAKPKKIKITSGCLAVILAIVLVVIAYGFSWLCTCGIIKLITMCFKLKFSWAIATGIWLVMALLKKVFNITVRNDNKNINL